MTESNNLSPAAQQTLAGWHRFVESRDIAQLRPLLADSIVFRSPYVQTPMTGRAMTELVLAAVVQVFEIFVITARSLLGRATSVSNSAAISANGS